MLLMMSDDDDDNAQMPFTLLYRRPYQAACECKQKPYSSKSLKVQVTDNRWPLTGQWECQLVQTLEMVTVTVCHIPSGSFTSDRVRLKENAVRWDLDLNKKRRECNHLQMSERRQHILVSYFKTLSVGPDRNQTQVDWHWPSIIQAFAVSGPFIVMHAQ